MESFQNGSKQIKVIIGLMLGIDIGTILTTTILTGTADMFSHLIRFSLTLLLCYFLYKGKNWARIVMIILAGLATVMGVVEIALFISHSLFGVMIFLIYTVIYGYCAITLIKSKHVKEYIAQSIM